MISRLIITFNLEAFNLNSKGVDLARLRIVIFQVRLDSNERTNI